MKYTITMEETVAKDFEVEANDAEEAYEIAEQKDKTGEFILDPGECQYKQMLLRGQVAKVPNGENFKTSRLIFLVRGCIFMHNMIIPSQYIMEK